MNLIATPKLTKSVKKLAKRYRLISTDLKSVEKELLENNLAGIELGHDCFKIRVKNSSVPTGKSGGFRIIYFLKIDDNIYLLDIYSKSDIANISEDKILEILKNSELV